MEQTALRPKPMPGQEPGRASGQEPDRASGQESAGTRPARRPHAAPRPRRRLTTFLLALSAGTVLVLSGVGLGAVGTAAVGMSGLVEPPRADPPPAAAAPQVLAASAGPRPTPSTTPRPARAGAAASLGVEAVDAEGRGALLVGVHVPGPAHTAGLVRGDVLLGFGATRVDGAADLARAVAQARPGTEVALTVRHENGTQQRLTAVPGYVT
ncbi:PDZ domain-containing protein [Streptomyces sp. NPDC000983]|uniref:PDZ domain-containing protein n=1 Tax=Streptomyces sp. NPDC000983 TaxID=3154373 RepID=UPI0033262EA0